MLLGGEGADYLKGTPGFDRDFGGPGGDRCHSDDDVFSSCESIGP